MQHDLLKRIILEQHEVIRRAEIVPRTIMLSPEVYQVLTDCQEDCGNCDE